MKPRRLTAAQALVKYLCAQRVEVDGGNCSTNRGYEIAGG